MVGVKLENVKTFLAVIISLYTIFEKYKYYIRTYIILYAFYVANFTFL